MTDLSSIKLIRANIEQLTSNRVEQNFMPIGPRKKEINDAQEIKAVCQEFESLFLHYLLKEMRDTIPKSDLLDCGQAERIYTSMYDEQLSKELAQKGGVGLAQMLEKSLLKYHNTQVNE